MRSASLEIHLELDPEQMRRVTQRHHVEAPDLHFADWAADKLGEDLPTLGAEQIKEEFRDVLVETVKKTCRSTLDADVICDAFNAAVNRLVRR